MGISREYILTAVFIACNFFILGKMAQIVSTEPENSENTSQLEIMLSDMEPSSGNTYGNIYTLDGVRMTEHLFVDKQKGTDGEIQTKIDKDSTRSNLQNNVYKPTQECFASVIGLKHDSSYGLLETMENILCTNIEYENKKHSVGDSLITTIVSTGQQKAYEEIQDYVGKCKWCTIVVVNGDGAILVDAGSNSSAIKGYVETLQAHYASPYSNLDIEPEAPNYLYSYYDLGIEPAQTAEAVGAPFKAVTARILQLNDEALGDFSLSNENYSELPSIILKDGDKSVEIKNSDYEQKKDAYPRNSSLAQAFLHDSDTYFLDHVQKLKLDTFQQQLNQYFFLQSNAKIDAHTLPAMPFTAEEANVNTSCFFEKVSFGKEARLTPVRLASLFQHAISGKYYPPFMIAQVRNPSNETICYTSPEENQNYHFDVDMQHDIVVDSLRQTFDSYLKSAVKDKKWKEFPDDLLNSGRFLAVGGNVPKSKSKNYTMAVSLLDESKENIICTAVMTANYMDDGNQENQRLASNQEMLFRLLEVLKSMEMISDES